MSANKPIGGDFGLSVDWLSQPSEFDLLPFPGNKKCHHFCDTGRSALLLVLLYLKEQRGICTAWLPYFSCHSIVQPFIQADFTIHYYSMGDSLTSPAYLPHQLDNTVFLLIHYFGKENSEVVKYLEHQRCLNQSFYVIEDLVQTCLSPRFGFVGDFLIHSLRKFTPLPDGAIISTSEKMSVQCYEVNEQYVTTKLLSKLLRQTKQSEEDFLALYETAELSLDQKIIPRSMSFLSEYLSLRIDYMQLQQKRVDNWRQLDQMLKKSLSGTDLMVPLYHCITDGEIPLGYPVVITGGHRKQLIAFLMSSHIYCPVHWHLKHDEDALFAKDRDLSRTILTLPIDQRMDVEDIERMVACIIRFLNKIRSCNEKSLYNS